MTQKMCNACILALLLFSSLSMARTEFYLNELASAKVLPSKKVFTTQSLTIFFRPNCSSCVRLISQLQCLEDKYKIVLLGFEANEADLYKEYIKLGVNYPAFKAPASLIKSWGIAEKVSPQLVLTNENIEKLSYRVGYMSCEKLKRLLDI